MKKWYFFEIILTPKTNIGKKTCVFLIEQFLILSKLGNPGLGYKSIWKIQYKSKKRFTQTLRNPFFLLNHLSGGGQRWNNPKRKKIIYYIFVHCQWQEVSIYLSIYKSLSIHLSDLSLIYIYKLFKIFYDLNHSNQSFCKSLLVFNYM